MEVSLLGNFGFAYDQTLQSSVAMNQSGGALSWVSVFHGLFYLNSVPTAMSLWGSHPSLVAVSTMAWSRQQASGQ